LEFPFFLLLSSYFNRMPSLIFALIKERSSGNHQYCALGKTG